MQLYLSYYAVQIILMDMEFECLEDTLQSTAINKYMAYEHVAAVE